MILEFFSMVSFINCLDYLHLTRFSWADKWQLIAPPNEYPSQRQKTTKKVKWQRGEGGKEHNANNKTGYKTLSYAVNWSVTQWTKELGVSRHTDTYTHRQVKQKRNSWNANWIWWEKSQSSSTKRAEKRKRNRRKKKENTNCRSISFWSNSANQQQIWKDQEILNNEELK